MFVSANQFRMAVRKAAQEMAAVEKMGPLEVARFNELVEARLADAMAIYGEVQEGGSQLLRELQRANPGGASLPAAVAAALLYSGIGLALQVAAGIISIDECRKQSEKMILKGLAAFVSGKARQIELAEMKGVIRAHHRARAEDN